MWPWPKHKKHRSPFLKNSFLATASVTTWHLSGQWSLLQTQHFIDWWLVHLDTTTNDDPVNAKTSSDSAFLPSTLTVSRAFNSSFNSSRIFVKFQVFFMYLTTRSLIFRGSLSITTVKTSVPKLSIEHPVLLTIARSTPFRRKMIWVVVGHFILP